MQKETEKFKLDGVKDFSLPDGLPDGDSYDDFNSAFCVCNEYSNTTSSKCISKSNAIEAKPACNLSKFDVHKDCIEPDPEYDFAIFAAISFEVCDSELNCAFIVDDRDVDIINKYRIRKHTTSKRLTDKNKPERNLPTLYNLHKQSLKLEPDIAFLKNNLLNSDVSPSVLNCTFMSQDTDESLTDTSKNRVVGKECECNLQTVNLHKRNCDAGKKEFTGDNAGHLKTSGCNFPTASFHNDFNSDAGEKEITNYAEDRGNRSWVSLKLKQIKRSFAKYLKTVRNS